MINIDIVFNSNWANKCMALGTVRLSEMLKMKLSFWIPCYYANYRCVNFIFWTSLFVNKKILCKFAISLRKLSPTSKLFGDYESCRHSVYFSCYVLFSRLKSKKCLFQDILGSRTLSDRVLVLLSNMETYLRFASREPTSAWESQLSHFEAFFRKLPSVLPENVSLSRKIYS